MAVSWIDTALKKGRERIELAIEKDKVCTYKNASNLGDIILSK
jgi:ribosome maturation protein Sdo1